MFNNIVVLLTVILGGNLYLEYRFNKARKRRIEEFNNKIKQEYENINKKSAEYTISLEEKVNEFEKLCKEFSKQVNK